MQYHINIITHGAAFNWPAGGTSWSKFVTNADSKWIVKVNETELAASESSIFSSLTHTR